MSGLGNCSGVHFLVLDFRMIFFTHLKILDKVLLDFVRAVADSELDFFLF